MQQALDQYKTSGSFEGVRTQTLKALERRGLLETIDGQPVPSGPIAESYGVKRTLRVRYNDTWYTVPTHDAGQPDYVFWDRAYRGKVKGLELAGLFLKPLASKKAAWVMGDAPAFRFDDEYTQEQVNRWFLAHHADVLRTLEESAKTGDAYLVVNPDQSTTVVPAHVVTAIVDEDDYSQQIGWKIREVHEHPEKPGTTMTIIDEYTPTERVRKKLKPGATLTTTTYPNLIDMTPVIHIPNNRGADERFGHPEGEALIPALHAYGEIFDSAIVGNRRQGRPTPVVEKMGTRQNVEDFWSRFGKKETQTLPDGTVEVIEYIDFSSDDVLTLGGEASFKWAQPGSFTGDTVALLGLIFYLVLQHTEFPEFIWGNAIASSKASAESQMPPFIKWIEKERAYATWWLLTLVMIVTRLMALSDRRIRVPDSLDDIGIRWPALTTQDGTLTLDAIRLALDKGLLSDETALALMPLDIEDPAAEIQRMREEQAQKQAAYDRRQEDLIMRVGDRSDDEQPETPEDDSPPPDGTVDEIYRSAVQVVREQQTGVMVAFFPDDAVAQTLYQAAQDAGLSDVTEPADMHITLAYLGDITDIDIERDELERMIGRFSRISSSLSGIVSGVGRFNTDEGDGTNPVYASVDMPGLPEWRQSLVDYLRLRGVPVSMRHGFTPHITLAYVPSENPTPNIRLPQINLVAGAVTLAWGGERKTFDLMIGEEEAA